MSRNTMVWVSGLLALAAGAALAGPVHAAESFALRPGQKVLALGDALTVDGRYLKIVLERVRETYDEFSADGGALDVAIEAQAGACAGDVAEKVDGLIRRHQPSAAIVCVGLNDAIHDRWSSADIARIVKALRDASVPVTLVTPPVLSRSDRSWLSRFDTTLEAIARDMRALERSPEVLVADAHRATQQHLESDGSNLSWGDDIHPNTKGHAIIAEAILKAWGLGKPLAAERQAASPASPQGAQASRAPDALGLQNGDMAAGGETPTGWSIGDGKGVLTRDTTVFRTGPASLRIDAADTKVLALQELRGGAGTQIIVTGYIRSKGAAQVQAALQPHNQNWSKNEWQQLGYIQGNTDWTEFSKTLTLPAWATEVRILILIDGNGSGWLDEVTIRDASGGAQ